MKKSSRLLSLFYRVIAVAFIFFAPRGCDFSTPKEVVLPPTRLSAANLQFGRQQVTQMMLNRPDMFKGMGDKDVVYEFVARQFAGEESGQRTYWSDELPDCGDCRSCYIPPQDGKAGYIQIQRKYKSGGKAGQDMLFEGLWSCAVYELYNARDASSPDTLFDSALAGTLSKQQWVDASIHYEFITRQKTKQFYQDVWYPEARRKGLYSTGRYWGQDVSDNYEEWVSRSGYAFTYLHDYYSKSYDETIAPHLKNK